MSVASIMEEAAKTFAARNATYGNNYLNVGKVLVALFPSGLNLKTEDDWTRFHILSLMIVKLTRYANNWCAGGHHDSIHDTMVYSAMLESIDAEIAERKRRSEGTKVTMRARDVNPFELCEGCSSPQTCKMERLCLSIIRSELSEKTPPFAVCNDCVTVDMCLNEAHCDRTFNGHR